MVAILDFCYNVLHMDHLANVDEIAQRILRDCWPPRRYAWYWGPPIDGAAFGFNRLYLLLSSFSSDTLTERNSTKTCHMFWSQCDLKIYVQNLRYPFLWKLGPKSTSFRRFSTNLQLKGKFINDNIFGMKHDIDNRGRRWKL